MPVSASPFPSKMSQFFSLSHRKKLKQPTSALLQYNGFSVSYESGIDNIPRFDAHIEVHGMNKVIRIQYDTPYIKGLPVTLHIIENDGGVYKKTKVRKSYEDPYTLEMKAFWEMVANGVAPKTTVADAKEDFEVFSMLMRSHAGKAAV